MNPWEQEWETDEQLNPWEKDWGGDEVEAVAADVEPVSHETPEEAPQIDEGDSFEQTLIKRRMARAEEPVDRVITIPEGVNLRDELAREPAGLLSMPAEVSPDQIPSSLLAQPLPEKPAIAELVYDEADMEIGRLGTAGSQFVRGATSVLSSVPKTLSVEAASGVKGELYRNPEIANLKARADAGDTIAKVAMEEFDLMFDPREMEDYKTAERFDKMINETFRVNPEYAEEFIAGKIPQGLGSAIGFMGATVLTGPVGGASMGYMANASEQFEDAIHSGASIDDATKASKLAGVYGLTEVVPLSNLLSRLDKGTGGTISRYIKEALIQGTEEAIQESTQGIWKNLVASDMVKYDKDRGMFTGVVEGAEVGFTVGALMSSIGIMLTGGKRVRGGAPTPEGLAEEMEATLEGREFVGAEEAARQALSPERAQLQVESAIPDEVLLHSQDPIFDRTDTPLENTDGITEVIDKGLQIPEPFQEVTDVLPGDVTHYPGILEPTGFEEVGAPTYEDIPFDEGEYQVGEDVVDPFEGMTGLLSEGVEMAPEVEAEVVTEPEAAFTPTHTLSDGTEVAATDEEGVWLDSEGFEVEDAYADPIETAVDVAAKEAATSIDNDLAEPTEAQKEAGNYKKGHVSLHGHDISIENPKGSTRKGTDEDGNQWESEMAHHYGDIKGTEGADGDPLDVFITDGAEDAGKPVFVIDQVSPETGDFDEHKVVMGAATAEEAEQVYKDNYADDWEGMDGITEMSHDEFKDWTKGDTTESLTGAPKEDAPDFDAPPISFDKEVTDPIGDLRKFSQAVKTTDLKENAWAINTKQGGTRQELAQRIKEKSDVVADLLDTFDFTEEQSLVDELKGGSAAKLKEIAQSLGTKASGSKEGMARGIFKEIDLISHRIGKYDMKRKAKGDLADPRQREHVENWLSIKYGLIDAYYPQEAKDEAMEYIKDKVPPAMSDEEIVDLVAKIKRIEKGRKAGLEAEIVEKESTIDLDARIKDALELESVRERQAEARKIIDTIPRDDLDTQITKMAQKSELELGEKDSAAIGREANNALGDDVSTKRKRNALEVMAGLRFKKLPSRQKIEDLQARRGEEIAAAERLTAVKEYIRTPGMTITQAGEAVDVESLEEYKSEREKGRITPEKLLDTTIAEVKYQIEKAVEKGGEQAREVISEVEVTDHAITMALSKHPAVKNRKTDPDRHAEFLKAKEALDYGDVREAVIGTREIVPISEKAAPTKPAETTAQRARRQYKKFDPDTMEAVAAEQVEREAEAAEAPGVEGKLDDLENIWKCLHS